MYLGEYLKYYAKSECIELNTLIRKGDGTLKNAVIGLLNKHKADKKIVARYEKDCRAGIDEQFELLMQEVREQGLLKSNPVTPKKSAQTELNTSKKFDFGEEEALKKQVSFE